MFDSLDEQMKHDAREQKTMKERVAQYVAIVIVAVVVFGGLYYAVSKLSEF
jgi:hypothetical protein